MSDAQDGRPPSRFEQARAMAREQAAGRQARRMQRHAGIQTASKATVSYLWLVQTYIVRALCLVYAVGAILDVVAGRVPLLGAPIGIGIAGVVAFGETVFARVISGWILRDTGRPPWRGATKSEAG